jgi:hypothetical protein
MKLLAVVHPFSAAAMGLGGCWYPFSQWNLLVNAHSLGNLFLVNTYDSQWNWVMTAVLLHLNVFDISGILSIEPS